MSTFVNSEDPDEMQHSAVFHQGLHYLSRYKIFRHKNTVLFKNYNMTLLDMYNGLPPSLFNKPEGIIHWHTLYILL